MKREITARAAIKKLKAAQLLLHDVRDSTFLVGYNEIDKVVKSIQEIKLRLDNQASHDEGIDPW